MDYEKIVSLFDKPEHAEAARRNLEAAGFPANEISIESNKTLTTAGDALREAGLWRRLFGRAIEQHEAIVYARTVETGGVVLTLRVPQSEVSRAMGILNAHKVVDLTDRAIETKVIPQAAAATMTDLKMSPAVVKAMANAPVVSEPISKEQVLRLAEEQLHVGKLLVQQGTTRIRRFVTERPVEAKITLHEEHAQVVRRAVTDPHFIRDIDWSDTTVEVTETDERAVVSKSAHVAEEVIISKEGSDRVETVKDKVRRQQVEVERRAAAGGSVDPSVKKTG